MPFRRRGSYGRRRMAPIIDSIKNVVDLTASIGTTQLVNKLAIAKDTPVTSGINEVKRGAIIKAIWLSFDICGLAASGVLQITKLFLMKNQGDNLTPPSGFAVGTSNEKNVVIKQWSFMTMRNQDGNPPVHWEGWIRIPKRFQRMGTDDVWNFNLIQDAAAGHFVGQAIYKWFT